jgi:Tol biopolymer transport system component
MIALMAMLMRIPAVLTAQEKITFQSQRESNTEVYVMSPDGSNQFRLTGSSAFDGEPTLSPNGDMIAFSSYRDGNSEIYIMNTNGSEQTNLTNNAAYDGHPAFSPDGGRIVFASMRGNHVGLWVMDVDGSNPVTPMTGVGRQFTVVPAWTLPQIGITACLGVFSI